MTKVDKLEEIFRLQEQLNIKIGVDTVNMTDEQRQQWVLNYCRAMTQEIAELTDSVPWKWWAKYQKFDKQNDKVEVIAPLAFPDLHCASAGDHARRFLRGIRQEAQSQSRPARQRLSHQRRARQPSHLTALP